MQPSNTFGDIDVFDEVERGTTIVMSSHVLSELDATIDYLLLVDAGRVRLAGDVEEIVGAHRVLVGAGELGAHTVIESRRSGRQTAALVRPVGTIPDGWEAEPPTLEELLLAYLRSPRAPELLTEVAA